MESITEAPRTVASIGGVANNDEPADIDNTILVERRRARRNEKILVWSLRVGALALFVAVWAYVSGNMIVDPMMISAPLDVARAFIDQLSDGVFWTDVTATFSGAMVGW